MNFTKHIMNSKWPNTLQNNYQLTAAASLPVYDVMLTLHGHQIKWWNVYQDVMLELYKRLTRSCCGKLKRNYVSDKDVSSILSM